MGNSKSSPLLNEEKKYTLEQFKSEIKRKITVHILCNNIGICITFVENLTGESFKSKPDILLENEILKKKNLYSFMNYKIYDSASKLMEEIKTRSNAPKSPINSKSFFAEVVIVLDNNDIKQQIQIIKQEINDDNNIFNIKNYYYPFFIFLSPINQYSELKCFKKTNTFYYNVSIGEIIKINEKMKDIFQKKVQGKNESIKNYEEINEINNEISGKLFAEKEDLNFLDVKEENKLELTNINENSINIINTKENLINKKETNEIIEFLKKLNSLFVYFNELGNKFSFINSDRKNIFINNEDEIDITAYINILLLGRTGVGKSTLINLLLGEKKALEGGAGMATTSKKLNIYARSGIPLRFYDAPGIENNVTLENYKAIIREYTLKYNNSIDKINAIFYCKEYKINGTIVEEMEKSLFEELAKLKIPILFIITKCPFDPEEQNIKKKTKVAREEQINSIKYNIENALNQRYFKDDEFKKYSVKPCFMNLVRDETVEPNVPIFGFDKLLSFFTDLDPEENWYNLELSCKKRNEIDCKRYCKENHFLKYYSDFEVLNTKNKTEALNYLKGLKAGAFFSGLIPALDIGMEYLYRNLFQKKLKNLYGFDYDTAQKYADKEIVSDSPLNDNKESNDVIRTDTKINNIKEAEKNIDKNINKEVNNKTRNIISGIRGAGQAGEVAGQVLQITAQIALAEAVQISSLVLIPVVSLIFGAFSCYNIHTNCHKILDIFDRAFTPLKFETLLQYIHAYRKAIEYIKKTCNEIIEDDENEIKNQNLIEADD